MARLKTVLWIAGLILVFDQISKYIIVQVMDLKTVRVIEVWDPFITFIMAWNRGINFGLFAGQGDVMRWVLIAVALVITGWVLWWMRQPHHGPWVLASAGLIVGGAIGNVIDRVVYGAVADFLNVTCCGIRNPWSFNVADIAIFVGAFGLILLAGDGKGRDVGKNPR
ncbi:MAG: signal peptidase II [Pseudomonadota bacterium]